LPGPNLAQWLRDLSATIFTLTPSALAALPATELPALRTITVAGEACPADLVARWADGRRFFNLYGPTEATIWATVAKCRDGGQKPPIGHPIANVQVYVLDSQLQPVTSDTAGELHIGGVGLARGYLNRSGLSAARFIPDPFSDEPGARLYKTGDWVRYWPDGELEFLDRIDQQVKVRGFRIELLEIETLLRQHPALREAVVLAREDTPGHKHLVAYVVPVDEGTRTKLVGELRSYLKQNLPEYMLPSAFVTLQVLPLTTSGKVNRQALPAPARARLEMEETFVAPRTPVEEQLAQIWSQVLGYEQIGVHDSFFNLGGHSLALTQVLSRLSERFRVELPIARFFETPSVSGLAEHIQRARQTKAGPELPAITPVPARTCTWQRRLQRPGHRPVQGKARRRHV
jgi:acyl carrier protein